MHIISNKGNISYITSNESKFKEACLVLNPENLYEETGFQLVRDDLPLEEIQGTAEEIVLHKTIQAFHMIGKQPIIVDDVSFHISALNGFPGPYIKWFLESLDEEGVWTLVSKYPDHTCKAVCMIGFMRDENEGPQIFSGELQGHVVKPRGSTRHGKKSWNSLLQPYGMDRTFGELSMEEISRCSPRRAALTLLKDFILR